jgi:transposase
VVVVFLGRRKFLRYQEHQYIYRWLDRKNLESLVVKRRQRKLNWSELEKDVRENPDARLIDRANKFGVKIPAIYYALKKMKITRKKNSYVIEKEIYKKE